MNRPSRESFFRLVIAATAMTVIGMLPINLLPILVESWVESLSASNIEAGRIAATEIGAMALASILLSFRVHRLARRSLALAAASGALFAHGLSFGAEGLPTLLFLRGCAGLFEGILLGTVAATVSAYSDPERLYAWVAIAGSVLAILLWGLAPLAVAHFGAAGAFATMALVVGVLLPFLYWVPGGRPPSEQGGNPPQAESQSRMLSGSGIVLALSGACVAAGQGAVWSFSGRIADAIGFTSLWVGITFGAATFAGTLGAGLAAWVGLEKGRFGPMVTGYFGILFAIVLITFSPSPVAFLSGQVLFALFYFFVSPYVMGLAAELDRSGRVASALSGALLVGAGFGPALGGVIVEAGQGSFVLLGATGALLTLIPGILLMTNVELRTGVLRAST